MDWKRKEARFFRWDVRPPNPGSEVLRSAQKEGEFPGFLWLLLSFRAQSFPRKRESIQQTVGNAPWTDWIPAFAGMTSFTVPPRRINFPQVTSVPSYGQYIGFDEEMKERDSSKMDELSGDVYENKGSISRWSPRSENIYENTGT